MKKVSTVLALALAAVGSANAAIINGSFEDGGLNGWSTLGAVSASAGQSYGGAGSVAPFAGNTAAVLRSNGVSAATLASQMGVTEAVLEASNGGIDATQGSLIWQTTAANAGDSFTFRWNFVEQDYVPYDDWAFYGVRKNGDPASVFKFASLATVGPDGGTTVNGWADVTVTIAEAGNYTFYFGIVDALDMALPSDLWIDNITGTGLVGGQVSEPGALGLAGLALLGLGLSRRKKA